MDSFMRFYASLLSVTVLLLVACSGQESADYGFVIHDVAVSNAYQSLDVRVRQDLVLSAEAREALEHGVVLTIMLELELHNDNRLMVVREDSRQYQLRYLPLSERYQLAGLEEHDIQVFSRLRHALAEIGNVNVKLATGPLLPGSYELRTRVSVDKARLPTPMQLPAWFSPEWRHDSEWSVWPFEISA
jgi:hypothetical protein